MVHFDVNIYIWQQVSIVNFVLLLLEYKTVFTIATFKNGLIITKNLCNHVTAHDVGTYFSNAVKKRNSSVYNIQLE